MEIIIALIFVVIGASLYYTRKKKVTETVIEAPYKVETPVSAPVEATPAVAETVTVTVDGHGDVQEVTPTKKPRKPRTPKATTAPKVAKAPVAKAPAKAKAPVAKKPRAKKV